MSLRFTEIDDLTRSDHYYLDDTARCFYLREYTAGKTFEFGETNNLISNFKKGMDRRGKSEWRYKIRAIDKFGVELANALNPQGLDGVVFVPIPPSKTRDHPEYDDRVMKVLLRAEKSLGGAMNIRELVAQIKDRTAAHKTDDRRLTPDEHAANYQVDTSLLASDPRLIIIFDDVITTGSSFTGMSKVLSMAYPQAEVHGMFIARCVHDDVVGKIDWDL